MEQSVRVVRRRGDRSVMLIAIVVGAFMISGHRAAGQEREALAEVGACCTSSGCVILTEAECGLGVWLGPDFIDECDPNCTVESTGHLDCGICNPYIGRCCFSTGGCSAVKTEAQCALFTGGDYTWTQTTDIFACQDHPCIGGCCLDDGTCSAVVDSNACTSQGGVFLGLGNHCDVSGCGGGCCLPQECGPDLCVVVDTEQECNVMGGKWQGSPPCLGGPLCAPPDCCLPDGTCFGPVEEQVCTNELRGYVVDECLSGECDICTIVPDIGACCYGPAECAVTDVENCLFEGGTFLGNDVSCDAVDCSMGACCIAGGGCVMTTAAECGSEHTFAGSGTVCTEDENCPRGACCPMDGSCFRTLNAEECTFYGGSFLGSGSLCQANNCEAIGCCTFGPDDAAMLPARECLVQEGAFLGEGVMCDDADLTRGACCVGDDCSLENESDCDDLGGTFGGYGTTCNGDGSCSLSPCLLPDGTFRVMTQQACDDLDGVWTPECDEGDHACACEEGEYGGGAPGSAPGCEGCCCFFDGDIQSISPQQCDAQGGEWSPVEGGLCADVYCPDQRDPDQDGLINDWEINGIPWFDADGDLHRLEWGNLYPGPPSPDRKTILIETDVMQGFSFDTAKAQLVSTAFINSPVPSSGPGVIGGVEVIFQRDETNVPLESPIYPDDVYDIRADRFGSAQERMNDGDRSARLAAKADAFRYMIVCDDLKFCDDSNLCGISMGIPSGTFCVEDHCGADTWMHELGHSLGLGHGGSDGKNWKPNYISVMNYNFDRLQRVNGSRVTMDYSRETTSTLDESALDETVGLVSTQYDGIVTLYGYDPGFGFPPAVQWVRISSMGSEWDWNQDGVIEDSVAVDLTYIADESWSNPSRDDVLLGWNDWPSLIYPPRSDTYNCPGAVAMGPYLLPPVCSIPDEIEQWLDENVPPPPITCRPDCSPIYFDDSYGNGIVNIDDVIEVINAFSTQNLICDVAPDNGDNTFGDGDVDTDDLMMVIMMFGNCP